MTISLKYPFPLEVRKLYIDCWSCWLCGGNGTNCGGLEIHHIMGRISDSALNSSCLCKKCHSTMGHSEEEERKLFFITLKYLWDVEYQLTENDFDFLGRYHDRLMTPEITAWIQK